MKPLPPELKGKKVSDIFMEFVEPLLAHLIKTAGPPSSLKQVEGVLRIPWVIWNAIEAEKRGLKGNEVVDEVRMITQRLPPQTQKIVEEFKERKKKHFSQYNYMFGEYSLYYDKKTSDIRIRVEAMVI